MHEPSLIWNAILSLAGGALIFWIRQTSLQISNLRRRVADTREEFARTYATKDELDRGINGLLKRFEKLDEKIDRLLTRSP